MRVLAHARANAIAYLALFVALGGSAYAVTAIEPNSVGTAELKKNAIVSKKVKNGSLLKKDFKAGQLPQGETGPAGLPGLQGVKGDPCLSSDPACVGPQGATGATGPAGEKGDKGDPCLSSDPVCKGPIGPQGPQGPQGPAGNGTQIVVATSSATVDIASACSSYFSITITAPSAGTILIRGDAQVHFNHTTGTSDKGTFSISAAEDTLCQAAAGAAIAEIPAAEATDIARDVSVHVVRVISVSAGTHTYWLSGYMDVGQSANDEFWYGSLQATFSPS